ncbi:hypothetical protein RXE43_002519 [Pseudomonas aeruginosa]|nr:hypothetical protein [Pseudomonas aeruginosa]EJV1383088.1 hypothetical protein [Pseudomonas aeruginosa]EJV1607029.1 hypothetical protein [Pseudomonas aeruginosa]EKD1564016.1 hypothetical protein [Pseudomonas aeruginosa]EKJ6944535.1 hypothetical protein [Pseudomonas aeruginosa]
MHHAVVHFVGAIIVEGERQVGMAPFLEDQLRPAEPGLVVLAENEMDGHRQTDQQAQAEYRPEYGEKHRSLLHATPMRPAILGPSPTGDGMNGAF